MNDNKRHSNSFITVVIVVAVGFLLFITLYRTDSNPSIATSPYSAEVIISTMEETEHIRFVKELGITPEGKTLFSYQWVNYGFPNAFTASNEAEEMEEALDMKVVRR